ncbi:MAG: hypothetical protein KDA99_09000 [Planctomycetales bacterium]|nr:hypothetical protein [Planctomycetales bacterium]
MSASRFIDLLADRKLIDPKVVDRLRAACAKATQEVTAEKVAKKLIADGHLTPFQAKELVDLANKPTDPAS